MLQCKQLDFPDTEEAKDHSIELSLPNTPNQQKADIHQYLVLLTHWNTNLSQIFLQLKPSLKKVHNLAKE